MIKYKTGVKRKEFRHNTHEFTSRDLFEYAKVKYTDLDDLVKIRYRGGEFKRSEGLRGVFATFMKNYIEGSIESGERMVIGGLFTMLPVEQIGVRRGPVFTPPDDTGKRVESFDTFMFQHLKYYVNVSNLHKSQFGSPYFKTVISGKLFKKVINGMYEGHPEGNFYTKVKIED